MLYEDLLRILDDAKGTREFLRSSVRVEQCSGTVKEYSKSFKTVRSIVPFFAVLSTPPKLTRA